MSRSGWLTMMILISATMMAGVAFSAPVQWSENGHYYEYMDNLLFWEDAAIAAETMSYMGHPGYLCTITSVEEGDSKNKHPLPPKSPGDRILPPALYQIKPQFSTIPAPTTPCSRLQIPISA
jgi:hypothetical protein